MLQHRRLFPTVPFLALGPVSSSCFPISNMSLEAANVSSAAPSLPDRVVDNILLFVPLADRLGSCSLVSKQFREAAVAATSSISVDLQRSQEKSEGVCSWLGQHAQHLTALHLSQLMLHLSSLPCSRLRELGLSKGLYVQLEAGNGRSGILAASTGLTKLQLHAVRILKPSNTDAQGAAGSKVAVSASPSGVDHVEYFGHGVASRAEDEQGRLVLEPLAKLCNLQHLDLDVEKPSQDASFSDDAILCSSLLQHLTQLTHLALSGRIELTRDAFTHISAATGLRSLQIHVRRNLRSSHLDSLYSLQHLTALDLKPPTWVDDEGRPDVSVSCAATPAFSKLSSLQVLRLEGFSVQAAALPASYGLQELRLVSVICTDDSVAGMLTYVGGLAHLSHLEITNLFCIKGNNTAAWPVDAWQYAALTASSNLQHLNISIYRMPFVAWTGMFHADVHLPQLQTLHAEICSRHYHLELQAQCDCQDISVTTVPGLCNCTALQELVLAQCNLEPCVLYGLTQLTYLALREIEVQNEGPAPVLQPAATAAATGSQGKDALGYQTSGTLLQLLSKLTVLRKLDLTEVQGQKLWGSSSHAYAGLLASSSLETLLIKDCSDPPSGFWDHATAAQHHLPQLRTLRFSGANFGSWSMGAVQALAARAPNLRSCRMLLEAGVQLTPLTALAKLTALTAIMPKATSQMAQDVAALTGLQELAFVSRSLCDTKVALHLTALTNLTYLRLSDKRSMIQYNPLQKAGEMRPVWQQLSEDCRGGDSWRAVITRLARRLAACLHPHTVLR